MTGWLNNWLTFSVPHITPRLNTLLKTGVDIVGIFSWRPTLRTRRTRCLWCCWTSSSETVTDKIRIYLADYNNNPPSAVSFMLTIDSKSGRLHREFIRLLFLQSHRETDSFLQLQEFCLLNPPVDYSTSTARRSRSP